VRQYLDLLQHILDHGVEKADRTGTGILSVFGYQARFDLRDGFPLLTTKRLHLRSIIHELLWFLAGDTNVRSLHAHKVTIWDEWAGEDGELGPIYGAQWRRWPAPDGGHVDQIARLIEGIRADPDSRRHLVSSWNVAELDRMALPPCHAMFQLWVADGGLSCQLYQRSADVFLGVPFNIASYALLLELIARECGMKAGKLIGFLGDAHIYVNHLAQLDEQMKREPYAPPKLVLDGYGSLFEWEWNHAALEGYECHPPIKGEVAV